MSDLYMSGCEMPKMTRSGTSPTSSTAISHAVAFLDTLGQIRRKMRYDRDPRDGDVAIFQFRKDVPY
jgi:hypothetical protein